MFSPDAHHHTKYSGNFDPVSRSVQVRKALAAIALQDSSAENIAGGTHVIRGRASSSRAGDRRNMRYIVNSHIVPATCYAVDN